MKICADCRVEKPVSEYSKQSAKKDGLCGRCKACVSMRNAAYRAMHKERLRLEAIAYRIENKEAISARAKARYRANPDKRKPADRDYYLRNRERRLAWQAQYRNANLDRTLSVVRQWRRQHGNAWFREYYRRNTGKMVAMTARRRAAKAQASPSWADAKLIEDFYITADGLSMLTGEWYHVDHIVPLQGKTVCGLHTQANLQVLPAVENLRKQNFHWPDQP